MKNNNFIILIALLIGMIIVFAAIVDELNAMEVHLLTVTAYNSTVEQTDSDPETTACMTSPKTGTLAVSRDLFDAGWTCGKWMFVEGYNHPFLINDKMGKTKGREKKEVVRSIDIYHLTVKEAVKFGVQRLKVLYIGNPNDIILKHTIDEEK